MGPAVRLEPEDAAIQPADFVPVEERPRPVAVLEIPLVDAARAIGDEEDGRREPRLLEHRRGVLEVVPVAVVERDDDPLRTERLLSRDVREQIREGRRPVARGAQPADLPAEALRGDPRTGAAFPRGPDGPSDT
jgi:hypothetical protein